VGVRLRPERERVDPDGIKFEEFITHIKGRTNIMNVRSVSGIKDIPRG
jgi:hypothetical protein